MRVAIDVTPLLGPRTGVAAFVAGLCANLPGPQWQVRGYATTWRGRGPLRQLLPPDVGLVRRPVPARLARRSWQRSGRLSAELVCGRADVVHGTNFVVPPTRRGAEVLTVHDLTFLHFPQLSDPATLEYPGLIRRAVGRGAHIHAVSEFVAEEVRDWLDLAPERVIAVHPGLSVASGVAATGPDAGRRLAGTERYLLALGAIEPRKDLPGLVRAFDQVAAEDGEILLIIAGPDAWGVSQLDAAVAGSAHAGRIRRLGWVAPEDRNALLAGATVLAYPSLYEGFGFPPLEALAAGIPVVATTAGALPEVLGGAVGAGAVRLVPPGDTDALATALAAFLETPTGPAVRDAGRAFAAGYRWDALAEGLRSLYRSAAAGTVRTRRGR